MKKLRLTLSLLAWTLSFTGIASTQAEPPAVYEMVPDQPLWLELDVKAQYPGEPILRSGTYVRQADTIFVTPGPDTKSEAAWVEAVGFWLESRPAPASASESNLVLTVANPGLQVTTPDGKALESLSAGSAIPNGSTVKVGESWAALTLNKINTIHLMPGSTATLNSSREANQLSTKVNLEAGGVFSKVGKQEGLQQDYRVNTPRGIAAARGTDYVTLALPDRIEVWIAEGVVDVLDPAGTKVGEVAAADDQALKVLRSPTITDPAANAQANAAIMTAAFGFVAQANTTNQSLAAKKAAGQALTAEEEAFLQTIYP
ncbi:MAG: FecR domain-containing protein [Blastochloris sp.]|nr:FecR domain-containing protein [Blastochloris sp.]